MVVKELPYAWAALAAGVFLLGWAPVVYPLNSQVTAPRGLEGLSAGIVFTQQPVARARSGGTKVTAPQLVVLEPSGKTRLLSRELHSASDPDVSFDGARILFAGRKGRNDLWQIFEIRIDGTGLRQITNSARDCRHPAYLSRIFTLDAPNPWHLIGYVSGGSLYSAKLDGSDEQRLVYTPDEVLEPAIIRDGRIIFPTSVSKGSARRQQLRGVNLDGTDYALFNGDEETGKRMPAGTFDGELVYVVPSPGRSDGAGSLALINLDRPLRSRRALTQPGSGTYHSPSGLPDGRILASKLLGKSYGIQVLSPGTGKESLVFDNPGFDELQAKVLAPRPEPDGRGSAVDSSVDWGVIYGLDVYVNDLSDPSLMPAGSVKRVRIMRAVANGPSGGSVLGEAPVETDGSFHIKVPANTPLRLHLLNEAGQVMRSGAWIYVRNKEIRGCIGCHEDGEMTPENREAAAIVKQAVDLTAASVFLGGRK